MPTKTARRGRAGHDHACRSRRCRRAGYPARRLLPRHRRREHRDRRSRDLAQPRPIRRQRAPATGARLVERRDRLQHARGPGPAYVVAAHGIGDGRRARCRVNPQRFPAGANNDLPEYLNINNVAVAARHLPPGGDRAAPLHRRAPAADASIRASSPRAPGMSLPAGETPYHFRDDPLLAQGQSMGAMYANMISAVEPRIKAAVPTGAGGYWSYFILQTRSSRSSGQARRSSSACRRAHVPASGARDRARRRSSRPIRWCTCRASRKDPLAEPPRAAGVRAAWARATRTSRPTSRTRRARVRAQEAGDSVWPTMQDALALGGLDGVLGYPVANDVTSHGRRAVHGRRRAVRGRRRLRSARHLLAARRVKYQYGCFFESFLETGHATVPAPAPLGTPCPM